VVNAAFNFTNFWEGRANNIFNGNNPFGPADPRSHVFRNAAGVLGTELVRLRHSSLASQAVGPPLSDFEMSWQGRTWPKVGKKMLSLKPLAQQRVHPSDSVLGALADSVAGTGLNTTYDALIRQAFSSRYWNNTTQHLEVNPADPNLLTVVSGAANPVDTNQFTQMEANFSLFFGLAVQLYEATLLANDSRLDRFLEGNAALTVTEQRGMNTFLGAGGCAACHAGAELTDNTVTVLQGANPITGLATPLNKNPLAANDFMTLFTGLGLYDDGFHNNGVRPGGATDPLAQEFLAVNEDIGRGGDTGLPAPLENFPLGFGRLGLRNIGFEAPALPAFLSPYVPPLPFGFRPTDTFPFAGRVANFGLFKTPGLRNVELTGPYMHNGGFSTLHQVVEFYARGGDFPYTNDMDFDVGVLPIGLLLGSDARKNEVVSFMLTLTDQRTKDEVAPFDHPELFVPIDGRAPVTPGTRAGLLANTARFRQIPAVGAGGRPAELLPPIGSFLNANHFRP
jgi:cytochrome c peroxidase